MASKQGKCAQWFSYRRSWKLKRKAIGSKPAMPTHFHTVQVNETALFGLSEVCVAGHSFVKA